MNITYLLFFLCIIICTLIITYWAARQSNTTNQFYIAAGSLTGFQNGMAIAGDYISAASFLGIIGTIAINGFDGFMYAIGFLVSYLIVLFFIAEPVHRLGKYSLGDVIFSRFPSYHMRGLMAAGTLIISIFYIIPQLVAAGLLIRLLLDIDYAISVLIIGGLMTIYVVFGGMFATSWVQIVKTVLLMSGTFLLALIVFSRLNWSLTGLFQQVKLGTPLGEQFFLPGNLFDNPLEAISLQLALILGTAGLPHILIRLFTVRNIVEVRKSLFTACWIIGLFYLIALILGLGTVALVGYEALIIKDSTGNLGAPLLAMVLGGDFLMAFISAIAFTTIIAVVAGLVISATTAFSHDIYYHFIKRGKTTEKQQVRVARWTAFAIGLISTLFALELKNMNVTFLVSLTFIVAASSNLPVLLLTLYWKRFNQVGAISGMVCGLVASLVLLLIGPHIMHPDGGWIAREAIMPLYNPGIITIPIGFLAAYLGTILSRKSSESNEEFKAFYLLAQTGVDMRSEDN
ncbi:solute symporter family protein [Oceanobacillus chungangensis]|uniref:Cation acetate symporter n=1 Tax=Oceanobacillus chungangensis TaxID=1229152 RepID=A0A3D8PJQ6_9BACI|nr:cation acetate symporter [Oceanobacillus chungangensis]RDW15461.1 cation acetate symporter [Oceanobacillus chungangensis]